MFLLVDDAIDAIRSQLDEENTSNLDDVRDILPTLNRAQKRLTGIFARLWNSALLTSKEVSYVASGNEVPKDAYSLHLQKVEVRRNGILEEIKEVSYRNAAKFQTLTSTQWPIYWFPKGNTWNMIPENAASGTARLWYLKSPDLLVKQQGRVLSINTASRYIVVDVLGADLSTTANSLNNFVNIWNPATGTLRCSLQIQSIHGTRVTFKAVPDRTTVLGKTISADLSDIAVDDYVSVVSGTCCPFIQDPWFEYVVQYAIATLVRRMGGASDIELSVLKEVEEEVKLSWAGRENASFVRKSNKNYRNRTGRRALIGV